MFESCTAIIVVASRKISDVVVSTSDAETLEVISFESGRQEVKPSAINAGRNVDGVESLRQLVV